MHFNPFKCRMNYPSARAKAEAVLHQCQLFAMQFVLVRPITSVAMLIADLVHESRWNWRYPQFYIMMIVNVSVFFAFMGLLRFFHVVSGDLQWCHPFSKFMCIKGIVFMTFWQGVVISFVVDTVFSNEDGPDWNHTEWSLQAQNFLICLEMFFFSIAHMFSFPTDEWEDGYRAREERRQKATFSDNLALRDFVYDMKLILQKGKNKSLKNSPGKHTVKRDSDDIVNGDNASVRGLSVDYVSNDSVNDLELKHEEIIDWEEGCNRIGQYIDQVDEGEQGKLGNGREVTLDVDLKNEVIVKRDLHELS